MFWKTSFDAVQSFMEGEFLKKDTAKCVLKSKMPASRTAERGICTAKKVDIIAKLCPLMPANRQKFWEMLPESAKATDLLTSFE